MAKPKLTIDLRGPNGNIYAVIGLVRDALKDAGLKKEAKEFTERAFDQGGYEQVLEFCKKYVNVTFIR